MCGWYACIGSMEAQYPHIERPTVKELQVIAPDFSPELTDMFDWKQVNNYSID